MGGKQKQAQRIKNNARPSSSGRSAELLASSQIQQFSSITEMRFIPQTLLLMKTEEFDSVSPEFQVVFKKMNKKDGTTKLKALQEFSDLVRNSDVDAVKTILPLWCTLYNVLATDVDHRVREAVHKAHCQVITKEKKLIAPYLKQLIGPWFTSQYDNYPPAASAASKAFTAAFPPNKVQDCVVFCQKQILTYIQDNLTTKLDFKNSAQEDDDAKFERIVISSLQGYCLYLETLTDDQIQANVDSNKQIISGDKFLKLATHATSLIRATWFKVLAMLYHKAPFLLTENRAHFVQVVFSNLDESEPAVVGFVWEAALLIMDLEQDWWKNINIDKNYTTKLRKVLREGGQGSAAVIYPNLLSFLHKLPPTVQVAPFYDAFFQNLRLGFKKRSVISSKSESTAVVTAFVECLKYVVLTNRENVDLCEKLIKSHLLSLVEWSLSGDQTCYRVVFHQLAPLLQYWNHTPCENYPRYLDIFWKNVENVVGTLEMSEELAERQVVLIQCLNHVASKEHLKVKFTTNECAVGQPAHTNSTPIDGAYKQSLTNLVYVLSKVFVTNIETRKSPNLLQHLFALIHLFKSKDFLLGLTTLVSSNGAGLVDIYHNLLFNWLKTPELRSEIVVDLTFLLLQYVSDLEKRTILNSLLDLNEEETLRWCLKNAFSYPYSQDAIVQTWLQHSQIGRYLVGITDTNLRNDCPAEVATLFKIAFTENEDCELLIAEGAVKEIVNKVVAPLEDPKSYYEEIDTCLRLAAFVSGVIYTEDAPLRYGHTLLVALFKFTCEDASELEFLSTDTLWEINTSWQDVVGVCAKNLPKSEFLSLVGKFATVVETEFAQIAPVESSIVRLLDSIVNFIKTVFEVKPMLVSDVFHLFFKREFVPEWEGKVVGLCHRAEYLVGNLASPGGDFKAENVENLGDISKYLAWSYLQVSVLSAGLQSKHSGDDDDDDDVEESKETIFIIDDNTLLIAKLLYDLATSQSFLNNYKMSQCYSTTGLHYADLSTDKLKIIVEKLQITNEIRASLVERMNTDSWLWCKAIYFFHQEIVPEHPQITFEFYSKRAANDLSKLHLTQVFGHRLDFDHVRLTTTSIVDDVVTLRTLIHCEEIDVQIAEVFERLKKLRSNDIAKFLFDNNELSWSETEAVIETIRLFSELFRVKFDLLSRQHWDFGILSLASWATNACKHRAKYHKVQLQAFLIALSEFYVTVCLKIAELERDGLRKNYVDEWHDLFRPGIHSDLLQLWFYLAEKFASQSCVPLDFDIFLQEFGRITDYFNHALIFSKDPSPGWTKIFKRCTGLLVNSSPILQLWAYKMLKCLVPELIEMDLKLATSSTPNVKGYTLELFNEVLVQTHTVVEGVLAGFRLGEDSCQVAPFTDSYTYVFAYLLMWGVLLEMCDQSHSELRYQYTMWLKDDIYFKSLLNNAFKLMPMEILQCGDGKTKGCSKLFLEAPVFDFKEPQTSERIEHLVCWIYTSCLAQLPALVRQWWSGTDPKLTQIVEKVTSIYISPQLCKQELSDLSQRENNFKNMTIKIVPSVREVIAVYTVDEAQMELVITLPQNYPLQRVDVRYSKHIGGPQHKQWLLQLEKFLVHQNGRIWDGLALWNNSLDKKFDGVEECYICFAVLHAETCQLPKLTCHTCKKKFHSSCLYKWFSTSNKSSCPICRNLF